MPKEKVIVVGGGVGPMAGVALHRLIIENTATDGRDQTHLSIHHFSRSSDIGDRTEYLLGRSRENPADGMARVFARAWRSLASADGEALQAVAGIPCNTFHAPKIFAPFLRLLDRSGIRIPVVHMLEETVSLIERERPGIRKIGLLSTTGTRESGVYYPLLERGGARVVEVPADRQEEVQEGIYHPSWGIKAVNPVSIRARERMETMVRLLVDRGAECVVLGCTEIPLALTEKTLFGVPLTDPVAALARALIREAAPEKLRPDG